MNNLPIFDGHNDTLTACFAPEAGAKRSFFERGETGHLDLPRAVAGGLKGGIFAIFSPPPADSPDRDMMSGVTYTELGYEVRPQLPVEYGYAREFTAGVIEYAHQLERESNGQVILVRSYPDLMRCFAGEGLAMVLHLEGAEAIAEDLRDLEEYYSQGVRSLGLVWSRPNAFGEGVPFRYPGSPDTGGGLTEAGKRLVRECSRMGILIDLAHLNERGFWDVAKILERPLVVSHTAVHAICPTTRNLTDAQIDAVARSNGIIGIMFEPMNLMPDGKPNPQAALADLVRHIDYIAQRVGIEHVGFGSDFDGADMPEAIRDASLFQDLVQALRENGFQGEDLEKIVYKNWLRVIRDAWSS
jgi:membrane dipeptidase